MGTRVYTEADQRDFRQVIPDLIRSRELLWGLVSQQFRARYRNAMMGFVWAVLQPLLMTLILTFVFSFVFKGRVEERGIDTEMPYAAFLLCGLIPWQFLNTALVLATGSLVENQNLIKKVYFPREIVPIAAVLNVLTNFVIGAAVLFSVHFATGGRLGSGLLMFACVFVIEFILVLGLALLLSSLNVLYRDTIFLTETILFFGFYATPIFYPATYVLDHFGGSSWLPVIEWFYRLNPMAQLAGAYRACLFDNQWPEFEQLAWPGALAVAIAVAGVWVFRRHAPVFADHL